MEKIAEILKFRNQLAESVNEALGVSNDVWSMSLNLRQQILSDLKKRPSVKISEGVFVKTGELYTTFLNKPLTVEYQYVNFIDKTVYAEKSRQISLKRNLYNKSLNLLTLHIISISGNIDETSLVDTIQHELHHNFQESESGLDFANIPLYQKALRLKQFDEDSLQYNIGDILYITFKHEIEAYANGLFAYLVTKYNQGYRDTVGLVMESEIYNMLQTLRKRKVMFLKYHKTQQSKRIMKWVGMSDEKLVKRIDSADDEIVSRMGRVIVAAKEKAKVLDDFDNNVSKYSKETVENIKVKLK